MKKCSKCKTNKSLDDFQRNRSKPDGLQTQCRKCMNESNRQSAARHIEKKRERTCEYDRTHAEERRAYRAAWRKANAERIKARNAAYRAANADKIKAYNTEYTARTAEDRKAKYRANPEPTKQRVRKYQQRNAEKVRQKAREWREANPERYRVHMKAGAARRRTRMAELETYTVTEKDLRRILSSPCAVPGCTSDEIQVDHVIPVTRGGSHGIGNFQALCRSHNASKGARLWIEFRVYLRRREQVAA